MGIYTSTRITDHSNVASVRRGFVEQWVWRCTCWMLMPRSSLLPVSCVGSLSSISHNLFSTPSRTVWNCSSVTCVRKCWIQNRAWFYTKWRTLTRETSYVNFVIRDSELFTCWNVTWESIQEKNLLSVINALWGLCVKENIESTWPPTPGSSCICVRHAERNSIAIRIL